MIRPLLVLTLLAPGASAIAQEEGQALGDIYLSAQVDSYEPWIWVSMLEEFNFYLVLEIDYADIGMPEQQATNGVEMWQCGVEVDPRISVLDRTLHPETSLNMGGDDNWVVEIGQNLRADTTPRALVAYSAILFMSWIDMPVFLTPPNPSSFDPAASGWNEFDPSGECTLPGGGETPCLRQFAQSKVGWGFLWVNPEIQGPVVNSSWGALKARFTR